MATLTVDDLMADLHLSHYTVVEYLKVGHIPGGFKVVKGGRWLVDGDVYERWKQERIAPMDPYRIEPRSPRARAASDREARKRLRRD